MRRSRGRRLNAGKRRAGTVAIAGMLVEIAAIWSRGYRLGGNVVVRCQRGHLFTTIWIPAASLKSLRLGWWRVQRCPVGHHWSVVTPVKPTSLTDEEKRTADEHKDIRIP